MKRQSLIKGTFILGAAGIIAKFMGLFFRWPLIMLIGDEGTGYYQMSYPLYMFFIAVASGVPVAVSKMVSERRALKDDEGTILVLRKALLLMFVMGVAFSGLIFIFSDNIIKSLKWDNKAYYSLIGIAVAPIFISLMSAFRGFYQGLQNMNPTAVSQLIEQLGRVVVGIGLAYILLPKGIEYAAGGAAFGASAGGILAGIYLLIKYFRIKSEFNVKKVRKDNAVLGKLIAIAVPISLGATVGTIMSLIDSILVPQKLLLAGYTYKQAAILYGQLTGKAFVIINVPLTLSIAMCASLVPIISEAYVLNRKLEIVNKVDLTMKLSAVIGLPSALGVYFMSSQILNLLFPGHAQGSNILKYLSICIPFIIVCQTTTAILQGVGRLIQPVANLFVGCIVKIIITLILVPIPSINIYGAVIGTTCGYITAAILNLILLKKALNIKMNFYEVLIKPAFASVFMIIGVVFFYSNVYNYTRSNSISCVISILIGFVIYTILIFLFGVFKYDFIKRKLFKK